MLCVCFIFFFFSSRRRHTRLSGDWSSDVCSSDLYLLKDISCRIFFQVPSELAALLVCCAAVILGVPFASLPQFNPCFLSPVLSSLLVYSLVLVHLQCFLRKSMYETKN